MTQLKVAIWFLLLIAPSAWAERVVHIVQQPDEITHFPMAYLIDEDQELTIEDVTDRRFTPTSSKSSLPAEIPVIWLRMSITNDSLEPQLLQLHNNSAYFSGQIDIYAYSGPERIDQRHYQIDQPNGDLYLTGSTLVYPFELKADESRILYIRVATALATQIIDWDIYDSKQASQALIDKNLAANTVLVILLTLAIYNLILFFYGWRKEYLFYSLYLINAAIGLSYMYGTIYHNFNLYGSLTNWFNLTAIMVPLFLMLFVRHTFDTQTIGGWVERWLKTTIALSLLIVAIALTVDLLLSFKLIIVVFTSSFITLLILGVKLYRQNHPLIKIFIAAYTAYAIGMTISTLTLYGAMPYSSTGFFASGIGLVVEALMFSYLLQHRIKLLEADIQRKRQGLLLKNRKAQQGELISAVSHQWKQPLTAISAIIMRLQYRLEDEKQISKDEIKPTLRQINEKIAFLSETLDEFRQFIGTRNSADRSDVTAVVERAVAMSRDELLSANIMIRTEFYFNDNPTVLKTELLHILLNLILNAKEAFESSPSESKTIVINGHGDREQITIDVEDNAGGIAEKHLNHNFDEFYSSKQNQQDRGLGLYLSKYIIEEQMQGSIEAISLDGGTRFRIRL